MSRSDAKLAGMKWRKISAPTAWRPKDGDELIGYYLGRTRRDGRFGQYEVVVVAVPYAGTHMISGTGIIQLADSAMLSRGDAVRIVYLGSQALENGLTVKRFELYVGETPRAEDMPTEELPS